MIIRMMGLCLLAVAAAFAGCATPTTNDKPLDVADVRDCPTGTRVCRKDGSMPTDAVVISGDGVKDAMGAGRTSGSSGVPIGRGN